MKILVVEDDFASRKLLRKYLTEFGEVDVATDGRDAVQAMKVSLEEQAPYDVIFLDIMLPKMSGQDVLKEIRLLEKEHGIFGSKMVKIIMTTALNDAQNIMTAFNSQCEAYITKPIDKPKIIKEMRDLELID
ncbi:MAG: response regulator [Spirochaetales bacterium]|nr:response regulator [Spirochaetales bacterium]